MNQLNKSVLDWISLILLERFGHNFRLSQSNSKLTVSLDNDSDKSIIFPKLEDGFHQSTSDLRYSTWDAEKEGWNSILNSPLPAPGVSNIPSPLIIQKSNDFIINYDILGLTYWMLNRIEEIGRTDLDEHQRFPATSSHAYKYGYLERPIVDEWLHILGQVIQRLWPQLELKSHKFCIKVSHDVDAPSRYGFSSPKAMLRGMAGDIIKRRDLKSALTTPFVRLRSQTRLHPLDPFNTFDWIMDQSEQNNLTSAFYFICGRTDKQKDADYEPEHPAIRELMRRIYSRGHEIGLHPSYNSFQSPSIIKGEADRLRNIMKQESIQQDALGGRMHFLRWQHPLTLQAWEDAGMSYDSTLGYADSPGFRAGTCFEYPAFNPITQKVLNVRIRPLIVMDCTVVEQRYLGLGYTEEARIKVLGLKEICRKLGGSFTLLWHNSFFKKPEAYNLYQQLISNRYK